MIDYVNNSLVISQLYAKLVKDFKTQLRWYSIINLYPHLYQSLSSPSLFLTLFLSEISFFKLQMNNLSESQDSSIIGITGDTVSLKKLRAVKTTMEKLRMWFFSSSANKNFKQRYVCLYLHILVFYFLSQAWNSWIMWSVSVINRPGD